MYTLSFSWIEVIKRVVNCSMFGDYMMADGSLQATTNGY